MGTSNFLVTDKRTVLESGELSAFKKELKVADEILFGTLISAKKDTTSDGTALKLQAIIILETKDMLKPKQRDKEVWVSGDFSNLKTGREYLIGLQQRENSFEALVFAPIRSRPQVIKELEEFLRQRNIEDQKQNVAWQAIQEVLAELNTRMPGALWQSVRYYTPYRSPPLDGHRLAVLSGDGKPPFSMYEGATGDRLEPFLNVASVDQTGDGNMLVAGVAEPGHHVFEMVFTPSGIPIRVRGSLDHKAF